MDLSGSAADETVAAIEETGGTAFARAVDVTEVAAVKSLVEDVVRDSGGLSVAVNNAGVAVPMMPVADVTDEQWHRVTSANLDGVVACLRAEVRAGTTPAGWRP